MFEYFIRRKESYERAYNLVKEELEILGSKEERRERMEGFFDVLIERAKFQSEASFNERWNMALTGDLVDLSVGERVLIDLTEEYKLTDKTWEEYKKEHVIGQSEPFYKKLFISL